jgi:hypothetical protein
MHKFRIITASAVVAALATSGIASAATAPVVSKERTVSSTKAPVAIGGIKQGARLPSKDRLVFRAVTLTKGEKATVTMTAPSGKTLRALARSGRISFTVLSPKKYSGKRSVKVRVTTAAKATGKVTGRVYALVR